MATLTKHRTRLVELREDSVPSSSPYKVDREAGIIFGVKVVGRSSKNKPFHSSGGSIDYEDVDGTDYSLDALESARGLYEGKAVNLNHPGRDEVGADRNTNDRFGKLVNVRIDDDGMWADLHFLKSHPMAPRVCEAAERMPDLFALSHNSQGDGIIKNRRWVVTKIPVVRSVDLVCNGGTNRSLFESAHMPKTRKLKDILDAAKFDDAKKKRVKTLLENYEAMAETPIAADEGAEPSAEEALDSGFEQLVCQIFGDESLDDGAKVKKIKDLLAARAKVMGKEEPAKTQESEPTGEVGKKEKGASEDKDVKESAQLRAENTALRELIEAGISKPPKSLVTALTRLDKDIDRRELIESFQSTKDNKGEKPRSKGQGDKAPDLLESRGIPNDTKSQLAYLLN